MNPQIHTLAEDITALRADLIQHRKDTEEILALYAHVSNVLAGLAMLGKLYKWCVRIGVLVGIAYIGWKAGWQSVVESLK